MLQDYGLQPCQKKQAGNRVGPTFEFPKWFDMSLKKDLTPHGVGRRKPPTFATNVGHLNGVIYS